MKKITLIIVGNQYHDLMRVSLEHTANATPDIEKIIVFGDRPIMPGTEFVEVCDSINSVTYSEFCLKTLDQYIDTEFVLISQYDGMAVNQQYWTDQFYEYDYIGAAWPEHFNWIPKHQRVGNGGFSLRSKRLLTALQDSHIQNLDNEDAVICQKYYDYLRTKHNIQFAPIHVADQFSQEWNIDHGQTFGFHGLLNLPIYFDDLTVQNYIDQIPIQGWFHDQLYVFTKHCERKNYSHSLMALNKKLTDYLHNR